MANILFKDAELKCGKSSLSQKLYAVVKEFMEKNPGVKPASFITVFGGLMVLVGLTPMIASITTASLFGGPELVKQIGKFGKQKE